MSRAATGRAGTRRIEVVRAAWGALLLGAPEGVLERLTGHPADRRATVVTRVLGARHLTQATLSGFRPTPLVLAMGVWVDGTHAVTAGALAAADHRRARAGLVDVAVAAGWAAAGHRDLVRGPATSHGRRQHRRDAAARAVLRRVPAGQALLTHATTGGDTS